jgi:hypothetical protein
VQSIKDILGMVESAPGAGKVLASARNALRILSVVGLATFLATGLKAQSTVPAATVHPNSPSHYRVYNAPVGITGLPTGPSRIPYPLNSTPANDAFVRNKAWEAYNANLHQIPTTTNPNRLAAKQNLIDQDRFIQRPNSVQRYNFQFSDNEIRSVQAALRRMGMYAGQVDGILGPDTQRAIEEYQVRTKRPVTGQPDQSLNAALGIF